MGVLLDSLPLLDPPVAALLAPMARCSEILRKRFKEQAGEELGVVLDVLEGWMPGQASSPAFVHAPHSPHQLCSKEDE